MNVVRSADLERELGAIHKGEGLKHPDLSLRVGPSLRLVCDIQDDEDHATIAHKIREAINSLEIEMNVKHWLVLRGEMNCLPECRFSTLGERQSWLASQLQQGPSTIRKWGTAARRMAASILTSNYAETVRQASRSDDDDNYGWHVRTLKQILRLDTPTPELSARREIVCTKPDLQQIQLGMGIEKLEPNAPRPNLIVEVEYGGRLAAVEQPSETLFFYYVDFGKRLHVGDVHEFGILIKYPPGQRMSPSYTLTSRRMNEVFDLRVRFDLNRLPKLVWQLDGQPRRIAQERIDRRNVVIPDNLGEVHAVFNNLKVGLSYGFQWEE